ncbi:MAG: hypothetical protein WAK29_04190 [Terriglobales bacterium]
MSRVNCFMKRLNRLLPLVPLSIVLLCALTVNAQESTTPQVTANDVITMKQAGLSDDLVIAKIKASNKPANLSTDELISLKKQNISDAVIKALMDPNSAPAPASGAAIANRLLNVNPSGATPEVGSPALGNPDDPMTPHDSGIYILSADTSGKEHMVPLERAAYQGTKTGGLFTSALTYGAVKAKTKAILPGSAASIRAQQGKPVFYFYFEDKAAGLGRGGLFAGGNISNPNQFALLKLNVEKHNRSTEIGAFSMWGASSGSQEKSMIAFKAERLAAGLYKVEINNELAPGEYCFVATSSVAGAYGAGATFAHDLFDFGVDAR